MIHVAKSNFCSICAGYHSYCSLTKSNTFENFNNFTLWKFCCWHPLWCVYFPAIQKGNKQNKENKALGALGAPSALFSIVRYLKFGIPEFQCPKTLSLGIWNLEFLNSNVLKP